MSPLRRRDVLKGAAGAVLALAMPCVAGAQAAGRVVVIGGGFAGATCARTLKRLEPRLSVTLVESSPTFTACPFSNEVVVGLRDLAAQQFDYDGVRRDGVAMAMARAVGVDHQGRQVAL